MEADIDGTQSKIKIYNFQFSFAELVWLEIRFFSAACMRSSEGGGDSLEQR